MSFSRYPSYKPSGVEWLGLVPSTWSITRFKNVLEIKKRVVGSESASYALLSLTLQGVIPRDMENPQGKFPADFDTYQKVEVDDLVFCLFDVEETPRAVGIARNSGMVTGAYTVATARAGFHPAFLYYYYLARDQYKAWRMLYTGLRNVIRTDTFNDIACPVPPLSEQRAIASFLDRESVKIDSLIDEQKNLIELLKKKCQAVIERAVTKGLNTKAPMKPSGVQFIGEVPMHWDVGRVKRYFNTCSGGTPSTEQQSLYYADQEVGHPWVRTTDLTNDFVAEVPIYITDQALRDTACEILPRGAIMIAMYGGDGTVGKNGLLMIPAAINQAICALLPSETHESEYVFRFMQFYRPYWMIGAESSRKDPNINQEQVRNAPILVPPLSEQREIVRFLDDELARCNGLLAEAECAIELLKERRSALITAAVTGQIDVRGMVEQEAA